MSAIEGHSLITLRVPLYPYLIHHGFILVWTSCWVNLKQGVGNESIFVMVDPFSKMAHLMSHTKTDNASCIVNLLFKKVVRFPWIPTSIYFFTFQLRCEIGTFLEVIVDETGVTVNVLYYKPSSN